MDEAITTTRFLSNLGTASEVPYPSVIGEIGLAQAHTEGDGICEVQVTRPETPLPFPGSIVSYLS
jgi:hypothetical protein